MMHRQAIIPRTYFIFAKDRLAVQPGLRTGAHLKYDCIAIAREVPDTNMTGGCSTSGRTEPASVGKGLRSACRYGHALG